MIRSSSFKVVTMKFALALLVASVAAVSGFSVGRPAFSHATSSSSNVVLEASRNKQKIASRSKWADARGAGGAVADAPANAGLMTNAEGLEYVKLVHPETGASSEIYLFGGDVTSYKDGDGVEYIAVRPDAKMDGSKPISGGISHCWPQVSL